MSSLQTYSPSIFPAMHEAASALQRPLWLRIARWVTLAGIALLALAVWSPRQFPVNDWLVALLPYDANFQEHLIHPSLEEMIRALHRNELFAGICLLLWMVFLRQPDRILAWCKTQFALELAVWCACTAAIFVPLMNYGHEGNFSPVTALMQRPQDYPITGNRLLLVWLADGLHGLLPACSALRCYLLSQFIATGAAVYLIGLWCAHLLGRPYRVLGQVVLAVMLIPTIMYYTFYDIAMVFFFTLALLLLERRRYLLFAGTLALGTMNHENTLLLVLVSFAVLYGRTTRRVWLAVPTGAFAVWVGVRVAMQHFMPVHGHFEMHVWTNLLDMAEPSQALLKSGGILVFWWLAAMAGFRYASSFLQRCAILLPGLIGVTFLVGKFIEARQWDAFLPVAIPMFLSTLPGLVQGGPQRRLMALQLR